MDFASILASEISKKRKTDPVQKPAPSSSSSPDPVPPKKYLKRSDIESQRRRDYEASQARLDSSRRAKSDQQRLAQDADFQRREATKLKQKQLGDARRRKEQDLADEAAAALKAANGGGADDAPAVPGEMTEDQAITHLRALGEPARLFGESHAQRTRRVKRYLAAADARTEAAAPPLTEPEMVLDMKDVGTNDDKVYRQLAAWFALVLHEWDRALEERALSVKESFQGKAATRSMAQAKLYMGPLFQHFKNRDLKEELYSKVCEIVVEAQARRYVKANDLYLRLSIGNAYVPSPYLPSVILTHPQSLAHRRHHGRHPRAFRARKTAREGHGRTHHVGRGDAQVPAEHQALSELLPDEMAARGPAAAHGLVS